MTDKKVVAITGASNGMGYEAVKVFAKRGWKVYAGARRVEKIPTGENIVAVRLDVTDSAVNKGFIQAILEDAGHIDALVNNAGYGEFGPTEEIPLDRAKQQFDTNYFGAVELTNLVLPGMREQGYGRILNVSSVGGDLYTPLGAHYYASKAALQQWSDTLDLEVSPFGIRSIIIQPAATASNWGNIAFENAEENLKADSPYGNLIKATARLTTATSKGATSENLAEDFYQAITARRPKLRNYHSGRDRMMVAFARSFPGLYRMALKQVFRRMK
ncbi:SDR family NAD(P)-dependent oxidoreductase [Lactococcus termiticola]|uniref:Short chain dehydrogenase n=1 Tax=Lactococcus termiticola TaxID=2169526 RepID=A0A2R5HEA9_9LACT|nr:SDR family NAD(P)-dependent oxidoreductase [Lactococcus termiticola]GBG96424.1 short chain dehydrogenase [Lactococcus termiticola]